MRARTFPSYRPPSAPRSRSTASSEDEGAGAHSRRLPERAGGSREGLRPPVPQRVARRHVRDVNVVVAQEGDEEAARAVGEAG